ncbi:MAG: hypothetical protein KF744_06670 [Taibaiella sp.]|nr:hypothetical protein [Taibaiella sp.]
MKETKRKYAELPRSEREADKGRVAMAIGMDDANKKHELVVTLLSMLQAPAASVVLPSFGDRNL